MGPPASLAKWLDRPCAELRLEAQWGERSYLHASIKIAHLEFAVRRASFSNEAS